MNKLDEYVPGMVMSYDELFKLADGDIIHLRYCDESGADIFDDFGMICKNASTEWSVDAFPIPLHKLSESELLENIDNSGYTFTIRHALPGRKGEFENSKRSRMAGLQILEKMLALHSELLLCNDSARKKQIRAESKKLEKSLYKVTKS